MSAGRSYHGSKVWARDHGEAVRWAVRTLAQAFGGEGRRRDWRDASRQGPRDGDQSGGVTQDGTPTRRQEDPSRVRASQATGGRASSGKSGETPGSRLPCSAPAIGDSARPRGEVRQSRWSMCPAGTGRLWWKRGGLVGLSPEALCEEAPKGHPMIRREHLVTVGGEDPEGHPMIHGCPRPHKPRPSGRQKGRKKESGPPSSRLTKAARKRREGRSPEPLHGKRGAIGRSLKEM